MGKEMLMIFGVLKLWVVKVKMDELRLWRQFSDLFMSTWAVLFMEVPRSYQNGEWWMLIFPAWWRGLSKEKFLYLLLITVCLNAGDLFFFLHMSVSQSVSLLINSVSFQSAGQSVIRLVSCSVSQHLRCLISEACLGDHQENKDVKSNDNARG